MQAPIGLLAQTSVAAAVQLHSEVLSHLVVVVVVEATALMVAPVVLVAVALVVELRDRLAQTLPLVGQVLKTLEQLKITEVVEVLAGQVFLEAEVVQVLQPSAALLLVVVVVGEDAVAITV
jgi:hypothetical protein